MIYDALGTLALGEITYEAEPVTYSDLVILSKLMDTVTVESSMSPLMVMTDTQDVVLKKNRLTTEVVIYDKIC